MAHVNIRNKIKNIVKKYLVSLNKLLVAKFYTKDQIDDIASKTKY